ncbi:leucyl aminopeptidase [uncultured Paludibaculum sp.]|uniref:leucyl aminopeptidase n=1 Tax=uncultured Paludibaculum sp. TaxID=1765020 RepID=UPI002AABEB02|nr:leucyl aminopeptidase [uncultured Paludibaculum sp.]
MELILSRTPAATIEADALLVISFTDERAGNDLAEGLVSELYERGEFTGKALEITIIHRPGPARAARLVLLGGGEKAKFGPNDMRKLGGLAVRTLKPKGIKSIAIALNGDTLSPAMLEALVEGAILGDFEPDQHKTEKKNGDKKIEQFRISVPDETNELVAALRTGRTIGEAQNFARTLVNQPGNLLTPTKLAAEAKAMAEEFGLGCEILDEARMRQLGMGALLGVSMGSAEPPAFVILRYVPNEAPKSDDHLAIIGKGVTFDTGGISIKPSEGMEKMKYDMGGAAAVIGAMRALAQLKPAIPITAIAPCVENMPGHKAQRPGDIVTTYQGKTVEVLNTDAEGRLILADALTYAARHGCTHLVNAATLTGAIAVALGHLYSGVFSNNEELQSKVLAASKLEGERMWPFPMDEDYKEYLKSAFADVGNIGGRWGGSITAAKFLEEFVESKPWVHLDIAGVAWLDDGKPFLAKGPTGTPVRTFVRLALNW